MDAIKENPYILVNENFGGDFFEADSLAFKLGFEGDCSQRLEAAVVFEDVYKRQALAFWLREFLLQA